MNVKKKFQILAGVIALIGMLAILFVCIRKYMPSSQRMSSEEYFGQLGETEAAVVVEDHIAQEHAQVYDGNVYIDYTLVQNELNSRFYWERQSDSCFLRHRRRFLRLRRIPPLTR